MGEDPYLVVDARRGLRAWAAERRRHRHPQALRRLLRLARRPATTARCRWAGASCSTSSCRPSRWPCARRRRLGDELLLRRRRRARRRRPVAAHRGAARRVGLRRARSCPTTGRCRSSPRCTGVAADTDGAGALALAAGHRRRAARHPRLRPGLVERVTARRARRGARRPRRPAAAHPEGRARPARPGLDAGGLGGRRRRRRPRLAGQPRAGPRDGRARRSCCSTPAPRCRCSATGDRRCAGSPSSGPCADDPRTFMGCYAFPNHVLPRYPGRGLGIEVPSRRRRAARRAARRRASSTSRAARCRATTGPASPPRVAAAREADLCVAFVGDLAGLFGHGTSGEGCDAEDLRLPGRAGATCSPSCSATGTPVVVVVVSGPPVRAGRGARPGRRPRAGVHARRGGRRRRSPACSPGGCSRAASCRCRSRGTPAASRAPTCSRRSAARRAPASAPRRDAAVPVRLRRARTPRSRSTTCGSATTEVPDRRRVHASRCGSATPGSGPATRSSSSTCTTSWPRWPGRSQQLAGFARVAAGARRGRGRAASRVHADRTAFTGRDLRRIVEPGDIEVLVGTLRRPTCPAARRPADRAGARSSGADRRLDHPGGASPPAERSGRR